MPIFRKKPSIVDAEQFLPPHQIPRGVMNVYCMGEWYTGEVLTLQGERVRVKAGEWIVKERDADDRFYPVADQYFKANFEQIEI